jgi:hypothetical protein
MLQVSVLSLLIGSVFAKYVHILWISTGSILVVLWVGFIHSAMGYTAMHALREGVYSAWSLEIGLLVGLLFERFVRARAR